MPLSTLDPRPALVVIDLQEGILRMPAAGGLGRTRRRTRRASRRSRDHQAALGRLHRTSLRDLLQSEDVTQVVVAGVATSIGVESTARSAHEHGYHVVLPTDAMTDRDPDAHRHSVEKIFPRLGETTTTGEILARLEVRR
jgi:nicotinamidase-related amidase